MGKNISMALTKCVCPHTCPVSHLLPQTNTSRIPIITFLSITIMPPRTRKKPAQGTVPIVASRASSRLSGKVEAEGNLLQRVGNLLRQSTRASQASNPTRTLQLSTRMRERTSLTSQLMRAFLSSMLRSRGGNIRQQLMGAFLA